MESRATPEQRAARIARLREIARKISEVGPDRAERLLDELSMRIPAEPDRDADLVLSWAADELESLNRQVEKALDLFCSACAESDHSREPVESFEGCVICLRREKDDLRARNIRLRVLLADLLDEAEIDKLNPGTVAAHRDLVENIKAELGNRVVERKCPCRDCRMARLDPTVYPWRREMILCETCGNKRCPHATNHNHRCTGSNEPGQTGSEYEFLGGPARTAEVIEEARDCVLDCLNRAYESKLRPDRAEHYRVLLGEVDELLARWR